MSPTAADAVLREAEARDQPYLTKLRLTKNVKRLIKTLFRSDNWEPAGQGWEGLNDRLTLSGWSRARPRGGTAQETHRRGTDHG